MSNYNNERLIELEARLAEAERDAARYRWLRADDCSDSEVARRCSLFEATYGADLDAAIDAEISTVTVVRGAEMSDLIERLRYEECDDECERPCPLQRALKNEAADEIERLRRELAEARSRRTCGGDQPYICHDLATARSELAEALAALKAHGIHLESANCWCKPEVVNYADDE